MHPKILVSAGEASGDLYASLVVAELRRIWPDAEFFGCTGPRLRAAGVRTVVDAASLAVVGLVEVVSHIPRIYGEYRKLLAAASTARPDLAILTDSPDFHLRVARKLHQQGVPVVYLVAPQAWAWRKGRVRQMRRTLRRLLCIFPFDEEFFTRHAVAAGAVFFAGRGGRSPIRVIEGESWDAMAHANLALAASGTVTVEAALLGTPMVTFYKVTAASWLAGKFLVDVPFYSMVNLIAGRAVVPELMQSQMTGGNLARHALRLLADDRARAEMKSGLAEVRQKLAGGSAAPQRAALAIQEILEGHVTHVS